MSENTWHLFVALVTCFWHDMKRCNFYKCLYYTPRENYMWKIARSRSCFFNQYKITSPKEPLRYSFSKINTVYIFNKFFTDLPFSHLSKASRKARPKTARLRDPRRLCGGERSSQNDSRQWVHSRCTCNLH